MTPSGSVKRVSPTSISKVKMEEPVGVRLSVVIADDEESIRTLVQGILSGLHADIRMATDVRQALALLRERAPDVLITDLGMPDQDGIEVIRIARREHPSLRIVGISGLPAPILRTPVLLGADVVLSKPFLPDQLLKAVLCTTPNLECSFNAMQCGAAACKTLRAPKP